MFSPRSIFNSVEGWIEHIATAVHVEFKALRGDFVHDVALLRSELESTKVRLARLEGGNYQAQAIPGAPQPIALVPLTPEQVANLPEHIKALTSPAPEVSEVTSVPDATGNDHAPVVTSTEVTEVEPVASE